MKSMLWLTKRKNNSGRFAVISLLAGLMLVLGAYVYPAQAVLKIDITQGHSEPLPIAVTDFTGGALGANISGVITSDLHSSGLFNTINRAAFIERIANGAATPRFADWRQINAQGVVTGTVSGSGGRVVVSFRLWDAVAEQQIIGKEYTTTEANWRRTAHIIADEIYKRLTGEDGYFDSRIVYVSETGPAKNRAKRLAIMDQDGYNNKYLTDGKNLVITPRFSPNSQEIIYMAYSGRKPRVYIRNLQTGREGMLGEFPGISFAPRFSPDGGRVAFSVAQNGNTDIYVLNVRSRAASKITSDPSIDTSPSFSPDGSKIVFNSDRGGSQQLYVMGANGGGAQRISFNEGRYGTPVWSPRGDWIAFTKMAGGRFFIGVMRPDGGGERILAEGYLVEGPTWSPNGRVIMYTRENRGGEPKLYSVDLTGNNEREIITPTPASDPAWSPLLPL